MRNDESGFARGTAFLPRRKGQHVERRRSRIQQKEEKEAQTGRQHRHVEDRRTIT